MLLKGLIRGLAGFCVLTALSGAASAATVLRVMFQGDPSWVATYSEVKGRFEAANPGVQVQMIYAPHDSFNEMFSAAAMAKQLPDILQLDGPYLANYVWSEYLRPIDKYIDGNILADMTQSNVSQGTYPIDKKLYAISLVDSTVVLYANKKYLQDIGARIPTSVDDAWTKDEFESYLAKLAKLPGVKWPLDLMRGYGIKTEWVTYAFSPILQSYGCDLISRTTWKAKGTLDSGPCIAAMTMMQNWVKAGWVVPQTAGTNQFFTGGNPAALAWGLAHKFYTQAEPSMKANLIVLPLPKFGKTAVSPNATWIWGITRDANDPALCGKFLSFLIKDLGYRQFIETQTGVPGLKSFAAESPKYAPGGPLAIAYEQATKTAMPRPPHPAYPAITTAYMNAVDAILNGADVKKTLYTAATKIDDDIEENAGYPPFASK